MCAGVELLVALLAGVAAAPQGPAPGLRVVQTLTFEHSIAADALADVDGDGRDDLVMVGGDGSVSRLAGAEAGQPLAAPVSGAALRDPAHALVTFADVLDLGAPQLVVAGPDGTTARRFDGAEPAEVMLARRAVFTLRTGAPMAADIARDLDGDGRIDLVLPVVADPRSRSDVLELWRNEVESDRGGPRFRIGARVPVRVQRSADTSVEALSDRLRARLEIPRLRTRDLDGDGREDLVVAEGDRRAFHLQRDGGGFAAEPDVRIDLSAFRDTTPPTGVRPGRVLAGADRQQMRSRDLDGDGAVDHVVAHRRKLWVFPGTAAGPQFSEPSQILKSSDDVTVIVPVRLDGDELPDLLAVKVVVPTIAALVAGMLGSWDIEVRALGYRNRGGCAFDPEPAWSRELVVRLPSISEIMRDAERIIARFEDVGRSFRRELYADVDGDGADDVLLPSEGGDRVEVWLGRGAGPRPDAGAEELVRTVLSDDDRVWDVDRILDLLLSRAEDRVERVTGGRPPESAARLAGDAAPVELRAADLDGDGRAEVVALRGREGGGARLDVLAWR